MNVPILTKRRAAAQKTLEAQVMSKALVAVNEALVETGTIEKGFLTGNAATMMSSKGRPGSPNKQPGTSWSNQTSLSSRLIARVEQNLSSGGAAPEELELALAQQGLTWGPPFPPGRPLDPFFGYRRPARTMDYSVGENTQLTPRWNRVSYPTIKAIYEAYDVAQICVRHLINDVRSLDFNWEPIPGVKADVSEEIEQAIAFFDSPDKRQPFRTWLAEFLQDVLRYDAGALYIRRNEAGDPIALEVVSGPTIIPLVDFYGRRPEDESDESATPTDLFGGETVPAYVQIIEGMPWDWLASDDLLYQPWNPLPDSQYGLAPLEAVLLSANTDIRFQWNFLQYFTEGTVPAGFMEAPPDQSDPAQIASWQGTWDAIMMGDQNKKQQIRWVPSGTKFTEMKPEAGKFNSEFPLYLMRRTCASFGVTPNDLGFTENVNRATGDTQVDVQFRVGTSPLLRYVEDIINLFTKQHLKLRVRIRFDDGKETEDRVATATADGIYVDHAIKGIDEVRTELGLPIDKSKPSPRFVNNTRAGPIPLLALESMAGYVDPDTYGVADNQDLLDTPYVAPPGVIPVAGAPEEKAAHEATATASNAMRAGTPDAGPSAEEGTHDTASVGGEETPIEKMLALLDAIEKGATDGITAATGIHGEDLDEDDEDEADDATKAALVGLSLRRWRANSRNRLKKGQAPKRFVDPTLPADVYAEVWAKLRKASSRQEVDAAFAAVGKRKAGARPARTTNGTPGFHKHTQTIVDYYTPLIAKAIGESLSLSDVEAAVERASAKKEWYQEPPNLRDATTSQACSNCKMYVNVDGACWGYSNTHVEPYQTCDSWTPDPNDFDIVKAAEPQQKPDPALQSAVDNTALEQVLSHLRGDAAIQGSIESAIAADSSVIEQLQCVVNQLPSDYWDKWEPGFGRAADLELERGADERIQGMTDTSLERLTGTISDGLANGDSVEAVAREALDDLGSLSRAETVVNTEYATSMTEANVTTYNEAGIEEVEWLAEDDACPECEANAAESPYPLDGGAEPPEHPNCRCALAPVVADGAPSPEADDAEKGLAKGLSEIDGLYSDKACSVIKPELPPGATGTPAKASLHDTSPLVGDEAQKVWDKATVQVSEADKDVIVDYTAYGKTGDPFLHKEVNGLLRGAKAPPYNPAKSERTIISLDNMIAKQKPTSASTTLYREINGEIAGAPGAASTPAKAFDEMLNGLKPGDRFLDAGYSSTAMTSKAAEDYGWKDGAITIEIVVPKGAKALNVGKALGITQRPETILPRGSIFQVISRSPGRIRVRLVEVT